MDALVEMLLVSSQLQSGSFEIRPEPIVVQELIFEVLTGVDLAERYIALDVDSSVVLRADRLLIKRAMLNLCSNIAKYTPVDCTVSIGVTRIDNAVQIIVSDTGEGVSDEKLTHLLEPFWRADQSRNKDEDSKMGWGLGLSFVQRVIKAHKGVLEVSHNRPTGLKVQLTIPISS